MDPISKDLVADIHRFVKREGVDLVTFEKGQRKDDVAHEYLEKLGGDPRGGLRRQGPGRDLHLLQPEKRTNPATGRTYPWIVRATAMVNQYYFYCVDADFGPFFIKFGSYFPYNGKLYIDGNESAKCQAARSDIGFEALDNGFASCRTQPVSSGSATGSAPRRSTLWPASGSLVCPTPSHHRTAGPATATTSPFSRPSSLSPRCSTAHSPDGCSSRR